MKGKMIHTVQAHKSMDWLDKDEVVTIEKIYDDLRIAVIIKDNKNLIIPIDSFQIIGD